MSKLIESLPDTNFPYIKWMTVSVSVYWLNCFIRESMDLVACGISDKEKVTPLTCTACNKPLLSTLIRNSDKESNAHYLWHKYKPRKHVNPPVGEGSHPVRKNKHESCNNDDHSQVLLVSTSSSRKSYTYNHKLSRPYYPLEE